MKKKRDAFKRRNNHLKVREKKSFNRKKKLLC